MLHKTRRYFVENRNENTDKQVLFSVRVLHAWDMGYKM